MIDLDELRALIWDLRDFLVRDDAWGVPAVWLRSPEGTPHVVRDLDPRHPDDRLLIWAFEHLHDVYELVRAEEVTSV